MRRVYFLARLINKNVGGGLLRLKQIGLLRDSGFEVAVVLPNYGSAATIPENDHLQIPFKGDLKISLLKQHLGMVEDYLDPWEQAAFNYLSPIVSPKDIVFASASGELSCLKLASRLKSARGSRYVANLHDPLDYSKVNGEKFGDRIHVSREKNESKYLSNVDLIITSSLTYRDILLAKYPQLASRIINNYFGYAEKIKLRPKDSGNKLRIGYGGSYQSTQSPEILAKAASDLDVEIYFIGNHGGYRPIQEFCNKVKGNALFFPSMEHQKYLAFMMENIDVGFVSLASSYLGSCVPSKIFEYLNLGIPIIGALPDGDAKNIINRSRFGLACHFDDLAGIRESILCVSDRTHYQSFRQNVLDARDSWEMKNQFASVIAALNNLRN